MYFINFYFSHRAHTHTRTQSLSEWMRQGRLRRLHCSALKSSTHNCVMEFCKKEEKKWNKMCERRVCYGRFAHWRGPSRHIQQIAGIRMLVRFLIHFRMYLCDSVASHIHVSSKHMTISSRQLAAGGSSMCDWKIVFEVFTQFIEKKIGEREREEEERRKWIAI